MRNCVILIFSILSLVQFSCNKQVSDAVQNNTSEKVVIVESEKENHIDGAAGSDEQSPERHYELGTKAHNLGNFKEAIKHFNKCIALDKKHSDAMGFRGISKMKSGDLKGACKNWENAQKLGYTTSEDLIRDFCK